MMKELEIRTTGELMLCGAVVATVTISKPFVEDEIAGIWHPEGYSQDEFGDEISSNEDLEDTISDLEDRVDDLTKALKIAATALHIAKDMVEKALPKFDWAASVLDANAIALLNEAPIQIAYATTKIAEVMK